MKDPEYRRQKELKLKEGTERENLARAGHPVVRLQRIDNDRPKLGSARGTFVLPEGWDDPLTGPEIDELFGQ
jgi:hypothetical protein